MDENSQKGCFFVENVYGARNVDGKMFCGWRVCDIVRKWVLAVENG
jgi:hypothetical protein